jgi:hypothetical protein
LDQPARSVSTAGQSAQVRAALLFATRYRWTLISIYFGLLVAPLVLASFDRPFGFWDYLTCADTFHYGRPIEWSTLIPNTWHHFWTASYILRPTTSFIYDLQVLLFGGHFWLWYAVKWTAYFGAIALAAHVAGQLGCGWAARISVVSLLLFHHARFTLMLHAPDGWVALGILGQIALINPVRGDIAKLNSFRYAALFTLAVLTMGAKEIGFMFEVLLCCFLLWSNRRAILRLLPFLVLIALWVFRLTGLTHRASDQFSITGWLQRLLSQVQMLIPASPDRLLDIAVLALTIFAGVVAWRCRNEYRGRLMVFCAIAATAMLAFTTVPPLAGLRYGIPVLYLLTIPFALAVHAMKSKRRWVAGVMIVIFPFMTAGQIYNQEFAYDQQFFANAHMLNTLESEARQGSTLVMTQYPSDLGGEFLGTIRHYFEDLGPQWYGLTRRNLHLVKPQGWPATRFALVSALDPEALLKQGSERLDPQRLERVIKVVPANHGMLAVLQQRYARLDSLLRIHSRFPYDYGAPSLQGGPILYIYMARAANTSADMGWKIEEVTAPQIAGGF